MSYNRSPYTVLGVTPGASAEDVRRAYLKLVAQWHPDRHPDNVAVATKRFQEIVAANQTLKNNPNLSTYEENPSRTPKGHYSYTGTYTNTQWSGGASAYAHRRTAQHQSQPGGTNRSNDYYYTSAHHARTHQAASAYRQARGTSHVPWKSIATFMGGLVYFMFADGRGDGDKGASPSDRIDAWRNPATRRWEVPPPEWYTKDKMKLQMLCYKRPRSEVYDPWRSPLTWSQPPVVRTSPTTLPPTTSFSTASSRNRMANDPKNKPSSPSSESLKPASRIPVEISPENSTPSPALPTTTRSGSVSDSSVPPSPSGAIHNESPSNHDPVSSDSYPLSSTSPQQPQ